MTLNKLVIASAMAVSVTALSVATATATTSTIPAHKIGICHATGSTTNPYVFIVVDKHAAEAHANHQDRRDIIGATSASICPKPVVSPKPSPSYSPSPRPSTKPSVSPSPTPGGQGGGSTLGTSTTTEAPPTVLPETGAGFGGLVGLTALAAAGATYINSRRKR